MKNLLLILGLFLVAGSATAQSDMIGVYFDPIGFASIAYVPANTSFDVYIAITEPSAAEVWGVEFAYELLVNPGDEGKVFRLATGLPAQAIDLGENELPLTGEYFVGLGTPLVAAPVVNFVVWTMMVSDDIPVYFTLGPVRRQSLDDGLPAYEAGGTIVPLAINAPVGFPPPVLGGGSGFPFCACLNDCVVGTEAASFGTVKALYR